MVDLTSDIVFDPSDPDTVHDPYPIYARLRETDPVHWNPKGFWFVSRYSDVHACLNDPRFSNRPAPFALVHARNKDRFAAADVANNLIAFKDAPEHTRLRGRIARAFARHYMVHGPAIDTLARDSVASLQSGQRLDAVHALAVPFASRAICRVLGIPEDDAPRVAQWSDDFFKLFHAIPDADEFTRLNTSLSAFRDHMLTLMELRRKTPEDDLISELVTGDGDEMSAHEVADNLMLLAADGVGNVQSGLANCLYVLLRENGLPDALTTDTAKARATLVDECLRLESPGQYQGRITLEPLEICGREIRAHSIVLLGLASANRDPTVFSQPDAFVPTRRRPQHLAFGSGAHMCMGNVLVRREISAILAALFAAGKTVHPDPEPVQWLARPGHRWPRELMLTIGRAA